MEKTDLQKDVCEMSDAQALELARLALYHPSIEDYQDDDVWIGEGDNFTPGENRLEVGCRCWTGFLIINELEMTVKVEDEEGQLSPIHNKKDVSDFLIKNEFGEFKCL